jgi:pseudouridine synthase
MIVAGRVRVNGEVVTGLGTKVNPRRDVIQVDGRTLGKPEEPVYIILNKPRGVLSSASDGRGRTTVVDLVRHRSRLYPVGRLDLDSEGLVLLTNDGALALRLSHPRYEQEKEYRVLVEGLPGEEALRRLRQGIGIEGGRTRPAEVRVERQAEEVTWLRIVLREGRKRQIRRMVEAVGHRVLRLIRVRMGPIHLGDLRPGSYRRLSARELRGIRSIRQQSAGLAQRSRQAKGRAEGSRREGRERSRRDSYEGKARSERASGRQGVRPSRSRRRRG